MKKIYVLGALCLLFAQLKAQNGVVFKIKYLPNHNYMVGINMDMKINATLTGDTALISKLKSQGITQPVNADFSMDLSGNMKSGALGPDKTFPLSMDYKIDRLAVTANGKQAPIPPTVTEKNIRITAHVAPDGQMTLDSAGGKKVNDTTEKKMRQMMDLVQKKIQFPTKPLKPGDSFTQGSPMTIPIGKDSIAVNATVTYKLVKISEGKAYFDLVQNLNVNFKVKKTTVSVTGDGTGSLIYSVKDNFPLLKESSFNIKIKVNSDKLNVDGTAAIKGSYKGTVN